MGLSSPSSADAVYSAINVRLRSLQPETYYHVTPDNLGRTIVLVPRRSADAEFRLANEPEISRICVAPDPCYCFSAINYVPTLAYRIYATKIPVSAVYPYDVADAGVTKERWLLTETEFVLIDIIPPAVIEQFPINQFCGTGDQHDLVEQRSNLRAIRRIMAGIGHSY